MTETELKEEEVHVSVAGSRRIGENPEQGLNRVKETIHKAATNISTGQVNSYMTCGNFIDYLLFFDHKKRKHVFSAVRKSTLNFVNVFIFFCQLLSTCYNILLDTPDYAKLCLAQS